MDRPRLVVSNASRIAHGLAWALSLTLLTLACDSGTQGPDAPKQADARSLAADDSGAETAPDGSGMSKEPIDPSRFPQDLPEGVEAAMPYNFPSDLPVYPGAQPAAGRGVEKDGGIQLSGVQLVTRDAPSKARRFYERELEAKGWTIDDVREIGDNTAISASKGGVKTSLLIAPSADGGSDIFVVSEG